MLLCSKIKQVFTRFLIYGWIKQQKGNPQTRGLAASETLNITERLLHPPDILITMNVDLMELVLQMFIFYIGHIIYHFQDYKSW